VYGPVIFNFLYNIGKGKWKRKMKNDWKWVGVKGAFINKQVRVVMYWLRCVIVRAWLKYKSINQIISLMTIDSILIIAFLFLSLWLGVDAVPYLLVDELI
jgi:hypothetical protein